MKLIRFKCNSCRKEFYCNNDDIDRHPDLWFDSPLCPFCVTDAFNKGKDGTHLCHDNVRDLITVDLDEIEFNDKSILDLKKISAIEGGITSFFNKHLSMLEEVNDYLRMLEDMSAEGKRQIDKED